MTARTRTITVGNLARVEGEGALHLTVENGQVTDLRLEIFEPPRFFEAFLRGRDAAEVPDLVARICGICPVAYQMSAVHALERALGIAVDPRVRALRRLYYCGEWIESHALHVHLLAAPDFLGCESVVDLAARERAAVERGLRLKQTGNAIIRLLGGRSVHPVGACLGGFTRAPAPAELRALRAGLERAREDAVACVRWVAGFDLPERHADIEFVALRHAQEYPMNEGRLVSSRGLDCAAEDFDRVIAEHQVLHSTALHARLVDRGHYLVGPLARLNLNLDHLPPLVAAVARDSGSWPSSNTFASIVARAIEILFAVDEAARLIDAYEPPERPAAAWTPRAGRGAAITEAPRGILYQSYEVDDDGRIRAARIVPPTSQNQAQIEAELRELAPSLLERALPEATRLCETLIRSYDPCISCATHFLRLEIERR
ncbi:MAG TPA: nickel-dependent hydrogenase large subunit [Candidatus Dormibacteraeota bacterium]|nr:nickel-dependent hydrogenase large subunit [Candidatus Dormibacteraeota bacterium]